LGVARCLEEARLRAGRIGARPATGAEMSHLRMDRLRETHDGRPSRRRPGSCCCVPRPFALGQITGSDRSLGRQQPPNTACGTPGSLGIPESPDAYPCGVPHRHQAPTDARAPGVPRALFTERAEGMRTTRARQRRENGIPCLQVWTGLFDRLIGNDARRRNAPSVGSLPRAAQWGGPWWGLSPR